MYLSSSVSSWLCIRLWFRLEIMCLYQWQQMHSMWVPCRSTFSLWLGTIGIFWEHNRHRYFLERKIFECWIEEVITRSSCSKNHLKNCSWEQKNGRSWIRNSQTISRTLLSCYSWTQWIIWAFFEIVTRINQQKWNFDKSAERKQTGKDRQCSQGLQKIHRDYII